MRRTAVGWLLSCAVGLLVLAGLVWLLVGATTERVPDEFESRAPLPGCGRADWLEIHDDVGGAPLECFEAALREGRGAELVITGPTDEGDPVTGHYRALPGGGLEFFVDARADAYASADWTYARCPDAAGLLALGNCTYREL